MATFLRLSSCSSSAIVDMEKVVSISSGDLLYRELLRPNWSSFPDPDNLKNDHQFITVFSDILLLRFLCSQQRKLFCYNWKYSADQQSKREYEINFYVRKMFGFLESTSFEFSCKTIHISFHCSITFLNSCLTLILSPINQQPFYAEKAILSNLKTFDIYEVKRWILMFSNYFPA